MYKLAFLLCFSIQTSKLAPPGWVNLVFKGRAIQEVNCRDDSNTWEGTCVTVVIDSLIYTSDLSKVINNGDSVSVFSVYSPNVDCAEITRDCMLNEESYYFLQYNNDSSRYVFFEKVITPSDWYFSVKESRGFVPDWIPYARGFGRDFKDKEALETYIKRVLLNGFIKDEKE